MFDQASVWAPRVGQARACRAFGVSERTYRHRRQAADGRSADRPSQAKPRHEWKAHPARLSDTEREEIVQILCSEEFADLAPAQVYATLLDRGSTTAASEPCTASCTNATWSPSGDAATPAGPGAPRVHATGPNQAWSWDISRLRRPRARSWFYLYVVIDIYSRKIVAWTIDTVESDKVARRLITTACTREGIDRDQLILHSDRGAQMTPPPSPSCSRTSASPAASRGRGVTTTTRTRRPAFKTAKYRPDYPDRFDNIDEARTWMRRFAQPGTTADHYHSAIGYLPPRRRPRRHRPRRSIAARQAVLDTAYPPTPTGSGTGHPAAATPPTEAWINKPTIQTKTA